MEQSQDPLKILLNLTPENTKNGKKWLKQSKLLAIIVRQALEALIFANRFYLRMHHVPPLYQCGIRYEEEPAGQPYEDFASVPVVIARKWGDCFPVGTLLLRDDYSLIPIESLEPGMKIWGYDRWSSVEGVAAKGELTLDTILLSTGANIALTPGHQVYVHDRDKLIRKRVCELVIGDKLLRPKHVDSIEPAIDQDVIKYEAIVRSIERSVMTRSCYDIQTDDHYVYLPEHDVTVSNCDDLVSWRIAELRNAGENAKVRLKWQYDVSRSSRMYHVLVRRADGTVEDPSLRLGMGTHKTASKPPSRMTP